MPRLFWAAAWPIPFEGLGVILRNTLPQGVHQSQSHLRLGIVLFSARLGLFEIVLIEVRRPGRHGTATDQA
jgi:hypothetical protein